MSIERIPTQYQMFPWGTILPPQKKKPPVYEMSVIQSCTFPCQVWHKAPLGTHIYGTPTVNGLGSLVS